MGNGVSKKISSREMKGFYWGMPFRDMVEELPTRPLATLLVAAIVALSWALGRSVGGLYWLEIAVPSLGAPVFICFVDLFGPPEEQSPFPELWNWIAALCLVVVGFQAVRGASFRLVFVGDWQRVWDTVWGMNGVKSVTSHGLALSDGATWGLLAVLIILAWLLAYAFGFAREDVTPSLTIADRALIVILFAVVTLGVGLCYGLHAIGPLVIYLVVMALLFGVPHLRRRGSLSQGSVWTLLTLMLLGLTAYHGLRGEHYRVWTLVDPHALLSNPSFPPHGVALARVGIGDAGAWLLTLVLIVCGWLLPYAIGLVRADPSTQGA